MRFADKLRSLMDELDITQAQLSDLTGTGRPLISQHLSEKKNAQRKVCEAVCIDYDELKKTAVRIF